MKIISTLMACGLVTGMVQAKDYILYKKDHVQPAGTVLTKTSTMSMKMPKFSITMGDQKMEGSMSMMETSSETIETKSATEALYTLKSSKSTNSMTMMGRETPQPAKPKPLLNVPVNFKKAADTWTASGATAKLTEAQQEEADSELLSFKSEAAYFGSEKRSVGDKWNADPESFKEFVQMKDQENFKGKVTITFQEIAQKDGIECAKLLVDFSISATEKDSQLKMGMTGKVTVFRSLKHLVDISASGPVTMSMNGDAGGALMDAKGTGTISEKIAISKK